jgi:signal transduction histidine kinase
MIEVIVKDTGIGIKEEDMAKLFKLFGFLDSTEELNTGGIGLGLHIS